MKTKTLGRTGIEVTMIGLGTIYIGSQPSGPPGDLDEEMGSQAVQAAIEAGLQPDRHRAALWGYNR